MPDFEDKIPISEFSYTNTLHNTDQAPIIQQDGAGWDNFRTSMADIGLLINKDMEYVTDLHTTSKKIIGAINELADGGGGSADIISEASGSIVTINDGGDNIPVKSLVTDIVAVQAGTGTPSPSNPRPITGFDTVVITNKDDLDNPTTTDTHTITLPETIYGGSLECVSGSGAVTLGYAEYDGSADETWYENTPGIYYVSLNNGSPSTDMQVLSISNRFVCLSNGQSSGLSDGQCRMNNNRTAINFKKTDITSLEDWKTWIASNPIQVVYTKITPASLSVSGENIPTLSGVNNIYSNSGDVEVEYFNENADQMAELIKVLTR